MKLLSLHIDGFGRLSNFKYDFSDDLNMIEAENGFGKTTLASFIKAMLYGLQSPNNRGKLSNNDRYRYTPWGGGPFGGSLDLETSKGRFRVTRRFGSKSSLDTFSLTDLDTGLPSEAYSENFGVELFGLDASSYEKSTYVPQADTELTMASDINAKLTGLLQSDDDMAEYDRAVLRLEDYMRNFKRLTGDAGLIQDAKRDLTACLGRIAERERSLELAANYRAELESRTVELADIDAEAKELSEKIRIANEQRLVRQEYDTYRAYLRGAKNTEARLDTLRARFKSDIPSLAELNELTSLCAKYDASLNSVIGMSYADESELAALSERFGDAPLSEAERRELADERKAIKELEASCASEPVKPEPYVGKNRKPMTVASIAGLCTGVVLFILGFILPLTALTAIGTAIGVAAAALLCVALVLIKRDNASQRAAEAKLSEYESAMEALEKCHAEICSRLDALEEKLARYYPALPGDLDSLIYRLENDSNRYAALIAARERYAAEMAQKRRENQALLQSIYDIFAGFGFKGDELHELLDSLKSAVHEVLDTELRLSEAEKLAEDYRIEKNITSEPPIPPETEGMVSRLAELRDRADRIRVRLGILTEARGNAEHHAESLPALRDEAEALETKIRDYEAKRATADRARKLLSDAKVGLSSRYLRDMETSFAENFKSVTGKKPPEALINANLGVTFREVGGQKETGWYSSGQQATIAVCLRLALIDALFKDERPFLVLDDPFTDLDPEKMVNAAKMLRSLSKKLQIIYFTCHPSRNIE